jgi:hypothetical protein
MLKKITLMCNIFTHRFNSVEFETRCSPRKINLSQNKELRCAKFTGSDLLRVEELDLQDNSSLQVKISSMFTKSDAVNDLSPICRLKSRSLSSIQAASVRGPSNLTYLNLDLSESRNVTKKDKKVLHFY